MRKIKKIAYISGTRADFGLITPVLKAIKKSEFLKLKIYTTGVHLMPELGKTAKYVTSEFPKTEPIQAIFGMGSNSDTVQFVADFIKELTVKFRKDRPDLVLIQGDRPETLATALACTYLRIPMAHTHGGDKSGTVDDMARHAITKLSHIHFPATKEAAERIKKMGEENWRIHVVGAPAIDVMLNEKLPSRKEVFKKLAIDSNGKFILLIQHPVSEEVDRAGEQMSTTIEAVKKFNLPVVVIYPHPDEGGSQIIWAINKERSNPLFHIYPSFDHKYFLAIEREAVVWIGNSSGAMIESPSFKTPVVNIGTRQAGRQCGENVINVGHDKNEIFRAINKSLNDKKYLAKLAKIKNPWGDGKTGPRVAKILENINIDDRLLTKKITY
ncbi:MAG: UDP-N-acetyl-D-glucosamine 2-epimerase, UDP-hydrolysing [Candidatus Yanofskybacteria bacterium RIFCSPLOWO2_01_FULL_41_34]|uniref:UDP-N-acetyl-D-glucosamine 2-epimerase, UDP-hydrolysing n=1 Tax=Candidatus Yanofskybacteria bacterium RIFCSPHIGHO2_01_FULL_41_26 TaxID=1802661 RepID=A0A1F8EEZ9_9BACT|nr:MAG: UDP-N-acetyl-D-glucosamine 2-epimerase, UDP-hydrolysing [Candidatus Yanofskybacteria bacterium RIFCSPHIGHO2_01_FULL_41_26]OGN21015.1 MAG: UDP-N-acetyl-D-glucosamine 2-epimerase, UDP-hydrolysing [Candidatus Yanofskybacteria bacterium RIFCSPLOWO2_01_FULL_41_34]